MSFKFLLNLIISIVVLSTLISCGKTMSYCECVDIIESTKEYSDPTMNKQCLDLYAADFDTYREEPDKKLRDQQYNLIEQRKKDCLNKSKN